MSPEQTERAQYDCLSTLAGLDVHETNLRDHKDAYEALDKLMDLAYAAGRADQRQDDAKAIEELATHIRIGL